jgi:Methyltransferase domain
MKRNLICYLMHRSATKRTGIAPPIPWLHSNIVDRDLKKISQVRHRRYVYTSTKELVIPLRRVRKPFGQVKDAVIAKPTVDFGDLQLPYEHGEANIDEYLKKTSLSPWVPMPDSAARKMLDLAAATTSDFHVDLGSGDGRVNFHAIDYGISKSLGVDIDAKIVQVARERLQRRHPKPDLEFVVADLLKDTNHPVWEQIQQATIITMYFATEGLQAFRPLLEMKLAGRKCKILTCGYEMPEWISKTNEVVNAMPLYLYEWGTYYEPKEENVDDSTLLDFTGDDGFMPPEHMQNPLQNDKFKGMNVLDHTLNSHPIPGFNPNYKQDEEEWDYDWDAELESVGGKIRADTSFGHPPSMMSDATTEISEDENHPNNNNNNDNETVIVEKNNKI